MADTIHSELRHLIEQLPIIDRLDIPRSDLYDALYHCSDIAYLMLRETFKQNPLSNIPSEIVDKHIIKPLVCYCCLPVCYAFVTDTGAISGLMKQMWRSITDLMYDLGYVKYITDELLVNAVNYLCDMCCSIW